jgi:2-dehydro-3-deoxyphosphogluconate aldolase/(4S)-4-hydroxy-2-oxoglutarate aldolase
VTKQEVAARIVQTGIVPVVRASSADQALAAAEAVCAGGVPIVEVAMTVPGALEVIAKLAKTVGQEVLLGAGTVLNPASARRCIDAGAQFLISPGFDLETVTFAAGQGVLMIAGALTPTEVITAWNAGSDLVKVFPCGPVGGASYIKALRAPLPDIPLVPTGGVNLNTAADFIRAGAAALGIGGELISAAGLKAGNTRAITEAARQYVAIVQEARAGAAVAGK